MHWGNFEDFSGAYMHYIDCKLRIRSFSGPYSIQMRENTDHKTSEYRYFSRSGTEEVS